MNVNMSIMMNEQDVLMMMRIDELLFAADVQ
jgi:hypothetical protein